MKVLMFQPRFAEVVRAGAKMQTIRPARKRPIKPGDELSLRRWIGRPYRSKQEIIASVRCEHCWPIRIGWTELLIANFRVTSKEQIAKRDGFENYGEMLTWFEQTYGLPFAGTLIRWMKPA